MDAVTVIDSEARRFADVLAEVAPETPVPTCPDWDAAALMWHLTCVHHFWASILSEDARTPEAAGVLEDQEPERPATITEMLPLREQGTAKLVDQLSRLDDAEPRWTWWDSDQSVGFTRRMQTHEATMHRVDAELTAGVAVSPIAADVAAGGLDHCLDVMWRWMPEWGRYEELAVVRFEASDTGQDWLVEIGHWTGTAPESGDPYDWPLAKRADSESAQPGAVVRGTVQDLDLWAWGRGTEVAIAGDSNARSAVEALIRHGLQ